MKLVFNWPWKAKSKPLISLEACLTRDEAEQLKSLNFQEVLEMDSADRIKAFTSLLGEQKGIFVNTKLERDVILKNQKEGLMNWINGEEDVQPKWRKEIVRDIEELDRALSAKEMDSFIDNLASLKLGVGVTREEARNITDLCNKANDAKAAIERGGSVADYEKAQKELNDYQ